MFLTGKVDLVPVPARNGEQTSRQKRKAKPWSLNSGQGRGVGMGSLGFGGGVSVYFDEAGDQTGHTPRMESPLYRPHQNRPPSTPTIPPENNVPKECSLLSMEALREWFCKGADLTSPAEHEAALYQLEEYPPDILVKFQTANGGGKPFMNWFSLRAAKRGPKKVGLQASPPQRSKERFASRSTSSTSKHEVKKRSSSGFLEILGSPHS